MTEQKNRRRILWMLLCLILAFIWGNSLMPPAISQGFSQWARAVLNSLIGATGGGTQIAGDGILRKIAHAAEFAALGAVLAGLMNPVKRDKFPAMLLCGTGTALVDETIQLFVAGRAGMVRDIWIDLGGFIVGSAICLWILRTRKKEKMPQ